MLSEQLISTGFSTKLWKRAIAKFAGGVLDRKRLVKGSPFHFGDGRTLPAARPPNSTRWT